MQAGFLLISKRFEPLGAHGVTRTARSLEGGLAQLRQRLPDGVLVDESLPPRPYGAWQAAFLIRERYPELPVSVIRLKPH